MVAEPDEDVCLYEYFADCAGSLASDDGKLLQEPSPDKTANAKTPKERKRKRKTAEDPGSDQKASRKPSDNNRTINDYFGKPQSSPGRLHSGAKSPSPSAAQFLPCSPQPPPYMSGDFIRMQPPPAPRNPSGGGGANANSGTGAPGSGLLQQQQQQQQPPSSATTTTASLSAPGVGGVSVSVRAVAVAAAASLAATRAVQTDLTLDRLEEIETRSSAEMEVQSAKIDELTRRLTTSQKSIDTQKETITRCLSVVKVMKFFQEFLPKFFQEFLPKYLS
jgi:hypothetical protein